MCMGFVFGKNNHSSLGFLSARLLVTRFLRKLGMTIPRDCFTSFAMTTSPDSFISFGMTTVLMFAMTTTFAMTITTAMAQTKNPINTIGFCSYCVGHLITTPLLSTQSLLGSYSNSPKNTSPPTFTVCDPEPLMLSFFGEKVPGMASKPSFTTNAPPLAWIVILGKTG